MPIYAYKCEACGHAKDVLQKMSDPLLTDCPACGAPAFQKQLTAAGFQLKGSGWYVTDFKGGAAATAAVTADKSDAGDSTKGDSKVDPKPDSGASMSKTATAAESRPETKSAPVAETRIAGKSDTKASTAPASTPASGS